MRLDAFPLTPNGKIDRKALPGRRLARPDDRRLGRRASTGDAEDLVAGIWSSELERPVGRDDNFFDIGGHSLLAVKVFRRLSDETSAPLALTDIFRFPTVRTFAAHLAAVSGDGAATTTALGGARGGGADRVGSRRHAAPGARRDEAGAETDSRGIVS